MILRKLQNSPEKLAPVAMLLLTAGLLILATGISWPIFSFQTRLGTNLDDFLHGFTIGIAIALEIGAVVLAIAMAVFRANKAKETASRL
jgi:hypothetical protein